MNISSNSNQILFLNLPLFDEVLDCHARIVNLYEISSVVACGLSGYSCEYNPSGSKLICRLCQSSAKKFAEDFDLHIELLDQVKDSCDDDIDKIVTSNFALGLYRNKNLLKNKRISKYIVRLNKYVNTLKHSIEVYFEDKYHETYYVFNSRLPGAKALVEYCKQSNQNYITYDQLAKKRLSVAKNLPVLHPKALDDMLNSELKNIPASKIHELATEFMRKKINNDFVAYEVFTKRQKLGTLPKEIKSDFYAIYTSSEDEKQLFGDELGFPKLDQCNEIINLCDFNNEKQFLVRVHPNQTGSALEKKLLKMSESRSNLLIIPGASTYSTYSLLESSSLNISFGSSTSVESILLGKRTVLIGRSVYEEAVKIESYRDAFEFNHASSAFKGCLDQNQIKQAERWVNFISGNFCSDVFRTDKKIYVGKTSRLLFLIWRLRRILFHPLDYFILKFKTR